ncbi:hypothetical protein B0H11DRAFT_1699608 [Mycena galericulata]|nr:hypothetical protein B0H11DRAFT_1699608 [Mycena galericulata]
MPLDETLLTHIHASRKDANDAAERVKRSITSSLGFVSWFLSTKKLSASGLSSEDRNYVEALHLDARPKTGILFKLSRDYHEATFSHLLAHGVPVHYAWTEAEKMDGRFRRHSPDYWNEYSILSQDCAKADKEMKEEDLPSYSAWKEDLDRYDLLFQNLKAGKVGAELTEFKPHWEYRIVDFDLYGARTLLNWKVIRAYSERFKGIVRTTPIGVVCTFFRQNPIRVDEPAFDREWREHTHELSDFAPSERGEDISEGDAFYESTVMVREQVRNKWAPRPGRTFNSYNGREMDFPLRKKPETTHRGGLASRTRGRTTDREVPHSESSSSYGEVVSKSSLLDRLGPINPEEPTFPSNDNAIEIRDFGTPRFTNKEEALRVLTEWALRVTDGEPRQPSLDVDWNQSWLRKAILVSKDPRAIMRMKIFASCFENVIHVEDVLELAIRFGLPFVLYIRMSDARGFKNSRVSALTRNTLSALYVPGYVDLPLTNGTGGAAALYEQYRARVLQLLSRPHAVAFIGHGGILSFVATLYEEDLVQRFVDGPSLQVTEHQKGDSFLFDDGTKEDFYTSDQVSNGEIAMLLGHLPATQPSAEATLWPTPEVLESESLHYRGYISSGVYDIFSNLRKDIVDSKKYIWRTRGGWKEYLRAGNKGTHAPSIIPTPDDFEEGSRIFRHSFPVDWNKMPLVNLRVPEVFDTISARN